jgi:hypothetical protein
MNPQYVLDPASVEGPLVELLAGYLLASRWLRYPGADGMTSIDVVVTEYPVALAEGYVPGPNELARRHPELADAIAAQFGKCIALSQ